MFLYHWKPKLPGSPRAHWGDDTEANEDNQPWVHGASLTVATGWRWPGAIRMYCTGISLCVLMVGLSGKYNLTGVG